MIAACHDQGLSVHFYAEFGYVRLDHADEIVQGEGWNSDDIPVALADALIVVTKSREPDNWAGCPCAIPLGKCGFCRDSTKDHSNYCSTCAGTGIVIKEDRDGD